MIINHGILGYWGTIQVYVWVYKNSIFASQFLESSCCTEKKSVRWSAFSARASRPATTGFSIVGIPQNGTENVIQMDDLGVPPWPPWCPHFRKPPNGNRIWCFPATFLVELPEQWWQKVLEISSASNWYNFSPGKVWGSWLACSFLSSGWKSGAWEALSTEPAGTAGESPMRQGHSKGFGTLEGLRLDLACIAWHGLRALGHTLGHFLANLLWNHTCHYRSL